MSFSYDPQPGNEPLIESITVIAAAPTSKATA